MATERTALLIRCSREEAELIRSEAKREHSTPSKYVLNIVTGRVERRKPVQPSRELNRESSASPIHPRRKGEPASEARGLAQPQQSRTNEVTRPVILPGGRIDMTGFDFLISDLNVALKFIRMAAGSDSNGKTRGRLLANAHLAYDTVLKFSSRAMLTHAQRIDLDRRF